MLKYCSFLILFVLVVSPIFGQITPPDVDALQDIIVEKYYVAGEGDSDADLPIGATTWRVFAKLKVGYTIQTVNGGSQIQAVTGLNEHPLILDAGEGYFFNSALGTKFGSDFLPFVLNFGNAPLDSYLALNGATSAHVAVPKSIDTDGSLFTGADGFLQNNDPSAGIPVLISDGLISGSVPAVSELSGTDFQLGPYFGIENSPTGAFESSNTAWFNLSQVAGVTEDNTVFLGQFTTSTCEFSFQLNLQIIIPSDLVMQQKNVIAFTAISNPGDEVLSNLPGIGGLPGESDPRYFVQKDFLNYASTIDCTVSVDDKDLPENSWTLMPNPSQGQFNIRVNEDFQNLTYSLFSVDGRLIDTTKLGAAYSQSILEINGSNLSSGIYLVKLSADGFSSTKRLIVNR